MTPKVINRTKAEIKYLLNYREQLRQRYGTNWCTNATYVKRAKPIMKKLDICRRRLKRAQTKIQYIRDTDKLVCAFMGNEHRIKTLANTKRIKNCLNQRCKMIVLGRKMLTKYCMERGVAGDFISAFLGCKKLDSASILRRQFNKELQTNQQYYELYQRFKMFAQDSKEFVLKMVTTKTA